MRTAIQNKQAAATIAKSEEQKGSIPSQEKRGSREGCYKLESIGVMQEFEVEASHCQSSCGTEGVVVVVTSRALLPAAGIVR